MKYNRIYIVSIKNRKSSDTHLCQDFIIPSVDNFCKVLIFIFLIVYGPVLLSNFFEHIFENINQLIFLSVYNDKNNKPFCSWEICFLDSGSFSYIV